MDEFWWSFFLQKLVSLLSQFNRNGQLKEQNTQILQFVGHFLCEIMFHCSWLWNPLPIFQWKVPQTHESNQFMGGFVAETNHKNSIILQVIQKIFFFVWCFLLWKFHGLHCDIIFFRINYIPTSGQWLSNHILMPESRGRVWEIGSRPLKVTCLHPKHIKKNLRRKGETSQE